MTRNETQRIDKAIAHCRRHVERARAEVERRERQGMDAAQARGLLRTFQQLQAEHEAERARLVEVPHGS
jgi:hypothetical protein